MTDDEQQSDVDDAAAAAEAIEEIGADRIADLIAEAWDLDDLVGAEESGDE